MFEALLKCNTEQIKRTWIPNILLKTDKETTNIYNL